MSVSATRGRLSPITEISHAGGFCYVAPTPDDAPSGNDLLRPAASCLRLFEDDMELGPTHAIHDDIRSKGRGRFSHWGRSLFFSSSDEFIRGPTAGPIASSTPSTMMRGPRSSRRR